jgi:tetratricopeptide (TPR) repeat protein
VHAGNAARLEQNFRDIANQVEIDGRTDPQADVFELVRNWLRDEKNGKWLLVLDNADDNAVLTSLPSPRDQKHLSKYLPPSKYGTVIVTSRSAHAASRLVENRDTFHLGSMHNIGAQTLLRKKLGDKIDTEGIDELAAALEYMPLALVQAAAYIQKRAPHYSVQRYLEEFRRSDKRKASLLNQEAGHLRRDEEAKNSIIVTWQISFEHIRSMRRSAADVLSLMSFFDRQGIPKALLCSSQSAIRTVHGHTWANEGEERNSDEEESASEGSIDDRFMDDVLLLRDYSFISETTDPETLEMHSLVQLATQKWLEDMGQAEGWKQRFVSILCRAFPTGEYETWGRCQVLFPHAAAALRKRPRNEESRKEWAELLHNAAWYAEQSGNADEAETLATAAMEARITLLGVASEETLCSMARVGSAKRLGGRWGEAEQLYMQVMETFKTKLGADHPVTLTSMLSLASIYRDLGRWKEAEKLQVQVMETRKAKLGADHLDTIPSMARLATTYRYQGRWEEAEKLDVQVVETYKTKLGADHPDTLTGMHNLSSTYLNLDRLEEAEKLLVQVIEMSKINLRANHPDTLLSMHNLVITYQNQGRWEEAEKLGVQVTETFKTKLGLDKLGLDHPDTLASMHKLAWTYQNQGRWEEAEKLGVQVMETFKTKLGLDHPDTLTSMHKLAFTWKSLGQNAEAIALLQQCAQQRHKVLGANHPALLSSLRALEQWDAERAEADLCSKFEGMLLAER